MLLSETVITGFMEASITGAGLILAMYALIVPMAHRIFEDNVKDLNSKINQSEELRNKITPESKDKDKNQKQLDNLLKEIRDMKKFPRYLGVGVMITFLLYFVSLVYDSYWFTGWGSALNSYVTFWFIFIMATTSFFAVGISAILAIFDSMKKEFDEITAKQKVAEHYIRNI